MRFPRSRSRRASIRIGMAVVSVTDTNRTEPQYGKTIWRWSVRTPEWRETGEDLYTRGGPADALRALCSFLGHAAECYSHESFRDGSTFSHRVSEWASGIGSDQWAIASEDPRERH